MAIITVDTSVAASSTNFHTIQAAVNAAASGDTIQVADGTYSLGTSTLNITTANLTIVGESEAGVIIDGSGIDGYGILVTADGTSLSNFTLNGPAAGIADGNYGIKIQPDSGDPADTVQDISLEQVTVVGSGRSEIDLNGVFGATLSDVTADGNGTGGVGIAITDSANITLHNIATIDNAWGSVALYPTNTYYSQQVTGIEFTGTYTHNEPIGIFAEDASSTTDLGTVTFPDTFPLNGDAAWTVTNDTYRGPGSDNFTFYFGTEAAARAFALALQSDGAGPLIENTRSVVTGPDGRIYVSGGLSLDAALEAAGGTVEVVIEGGSSADNLDLGTQTNDLEINAGDGDNAITTGSGDDTVMTGSGNDTVHTGAGNDVVSTGDGNDTVIGGAGEGDDLYDAGTHTTGDLITYPSTNAGVTIDMRAQDRSATSLSGADGAGPNPDTVGDLLIANSYSAGTLVGLATGTEIGTDILVSFEHATGGSGNDTIIEGAGTGDNTYDGAAGSDTVQYTGITLTHDSFTYNAGTWQVTSAAGTDTLSNIEIVTDGAGNVFRLVGAGGYADVAAAIAATGAAPTDVIITPTDTDTSTPDIVALTGLPASVTEITDGGTGEGSTAVQTTGRIFFEDLPAGQTHSVSVTPLTTGAIGLFTAGITNSATADGAGEVTWQYQVNDALVDQLGADDSLTFQYQITINDNSGSTATQIVAITVQGTNDQPVITATTVGTGHTESSGLPSNDAISISGTLTVSDDDHGGTFGAQSGYADTWGGVVTAAATATLNGSAVPTELTASVASLLAAGNITFGAPQTATGAAQTLGWTYATTANLDFLGAGDTLAITYLLAVTDDSATTNAQSATVPVTITITGTNDAPVITGDVSGSITEAGGVGNATNPTPTVSGDLSHTDVDAADADDAWNTTVVTQGTYGTLTLTAAGVWTYTLDNNNATVQGLNASSTPLTDTIVVATTDGTQQTVTITINGTNDAAVITGDVSGSITEAGGVGNAINPTPTVSGDLSHTDVDAADADDAWNTTVVTQGTYGTLTLTAAGVWTYTLDNNNATVQGLNASSTPLTDTIVVATTDGTQQTVTITINGTNDVAVITGDVSGSITEAGGVGNATNPTPTVSGDLSHTDVDAADADDAWNTTVVTQGTYGTLTLTAAGVWTYTLDNNNATVQGLNASSTPLTDTIVVATTDGTQQTVTITITGTNDAAVITGDVSSSITEAGGVGNATDPTPTVSGDLSHTDVDAADADDAWNTTVVTQGTYGTLTLTAAGVWTYTLDNNNATVQGLNASSTPLTDTIVVATTDGTQQTVTITINGTNDAAVITGDVSGSITEAGGVGNAINPTPTVSGDLSHTDVDAADADDAWNTTVVTQGTYGTLTLTAAGVWTYTLDNNNATVQGLNASSTPLTDTIVVATTDGTQQTVTITINGTNDVAVITGDVSGSITEAGGVGNATNPTPTVSGDLSHTDVDAADADDAWNTTVVTQGTYGTLTLTAAGVWTYTLDNNNATVQGLNASSTPLTDTIVVATTDGTQQTVTITINGTNDAAVITGDVSGSITEAGGVGNATNPTPTVSGDLSHTDVDAADADDAWNTTVVTQGTYGTLTLTAAGVWTYTLDNNNATVQGLNASSTPLTDTIVVATTDGTQQTITITITGTNDVPVIGGTATGTVDEAGRDGSNAPIGTQTATGTLTIADPDADESSFQAIAAGTYGTFQVAANGTWTYTLDDANPAVNALTESQSLTDSITVKSLDGTQSQVISVTIDGSNDVPTVGAVTGSTSVTELAEDNASEGTHTFSLSGTLPFDDVELTDTHSVNITPTGPNATSYVGFFGGGLSQLATGAGAGEIAWTFQVSDAAIDGLREGETITQSYLVSITDNFGATTTNTTIDITITGTNDRPEINVSTSSLSDTHTEATSTGATSSSVIADGTINFSDADVGLAGLSTAADTHTAEFTLQSVSHLDGATPVSGTPYTTTSIPGLASISAASASSTLLAWSLSTTQGALDALGVGEELTLTYSVLVRDNSGSTADSASTPQTITITITGTNDGPVAAADVTTSSNENVADTVILATASATDADFTDVVTYSITGGNDAGLFEINSTTGGISLLPGKVLDAEAATSHVLTVTASDGTLTDTQQITINVNDLNDNVTTAPADTDGAANAVTENAATGTTIGLDVNSTDADVTSGAITYAVVGGTGASLFTIDSSTGIVTVNPGIDREAVGPSVTLDVRATPANGAASTDTTFTIAINDADEFNVTTPTDSDSATNQVSEGATAGTTVGITASASDADATTNVVTYSLSSNPGNLFAIDETTGVVTLAGTLNRETAPSHTIEVTATSADGSTAAQTFTINVLDVNDTAPVFTNANAANVNENTTAVLTLATTDADTTGTNPATLSITGGADAGLFTITGGNQLVFNSAPNFEAPVGGDHSYEVTVSASDGVNTTEQTITVTVQNVNEAPVSAADLTVSSNENVADTESLATASATDVDTGTTLTYSITGGNVAGLFEINSTTGEISLASGQVLDAEAATSHVLTVTASDGTLTDTQQITINVNDLDDNVTTAPADTDGAANAVTENAANGTTIGLDVNSNDPDVTAGAITYAIVGGTGASLFTIDSGTGIVTVNAGIDREAVGVGASVTLQVQATPANGAPSAVTEFTIAINDADEFDVSTPTDSDSATNQVSEGATAGTTVGITASASDADATTNVVTYSLSSNPGNLFAIDETTGVVTLAGTLNRETAPSHTIEVTATSADGSTAAQTFTINVLDVNDTAPVFTNANAANVNENTTAVLTLATTDADTTGTNPATLSITGGADAGLFTITGGNQLVFNSAPNFEAPVGGDNSYEVTVSASDGVNTTEQTITVTVQDVNEAPTAVTLDNTTTTVAENVNLTGGLKVADITITDDALGTNGITLNGADATQFEVRNGTGGPELWFIGGTQNYENPTDAGADHVFDVTVSVADATVSGSSPVIQAFSLTVTNVNDAPIAVDDAFGLSEGAFTSSVNVLTLGTDDSDADGNPIAVTALADGDDSPAAFSPASSPVTPSSAGVIVTDWGAEVVLQSNGQLSYNLTSGTALFNTLRAGQTAVDTFSYTVSDGQGGTDTATVAVTITGVNDAIVATSDSITTTEDAAATVSGNLLSNDVDVDVGDSRTIIAVNNSATATAVVTSGGYQITTNAGVVVTLAADGSYTLTAPQNLAGGQTYTATFQYTVQDGGGAQSTTTVTVQVSGDNDAPTADLVTLTASNEDATRTITAMELLSGASDPDLGHTLTITNLSLTSGNGALVDNGNGTWTYTPALNDNSSVTFSYIASDGTLTATASANLDLLPVNDAPAGNVTISGTAVEDGTLTADTSAITDADGPGTFAYQWYADGVAITGATNATFTPGDAEVGAAITVAVSYTDGNGTPETLTSDPTAAVANVNDAPAGNVTISGTAVEDGTLTADTSAITDADGPGTFAYQWSADGVAITGATNATFTPGDAEVGAAITVTVSYTDGNGTPETLTSAATAAVANVNDLPVGNVTISGTAVEDGTLTADTAITDADGLGTFAYQWSADGVAITGATNATFTPGDAEVGAAITVTVSYTDGNGTPETLTSAATAAVANVNDLPVGNVTISGTAVEDGTLTADTSAITDADGLGTFAYQWSADGVAITGATNATFTPGDAEVGAAITVTVSYTDGNGTPETLTSAPTAAVANVNDAPVGNVTISGTAVEDGTLTADTSAITDADGLGTFAYQWSADGVAITGATNATFTPGDAEVGAAITVTVSYTDGNGTPETLTSAATAAVANVNDLPVGNVTISGTAVEDGTLTADTSAITDADGLGTFAYQWSADGVAITGATNATFTPGDAEVGAAITVTVSYTDGNGTPETLTSAPTAAVANVNDAPVGNVTISGTAVEDGTLTADTSAITDADGLGTFAYQWSADGVAITGATNATFTPGDAEVGAAITVTVSYTDGNGTPETLTSAATAAVANVNDLPVGNVTISGTAVEDGTLTADTSAITDADGPGTFAYQWSADGVAITGATNATFTPGDAEVGAAITVTVSYTDGNGTPETLTSAATAAVANVNDLPVGNVTISGTAVEDGTLTADTSAITDADGLGTFAYQWSADGVAITGATNATFTPGDAEVGAAITVTVSYTDGNGTPETLTSAATAAVGNVNDAPAGNVTISGTAVEDGTLTADTSAITDADGLGTFAYQWSADGVAITGATNATFTPGDAEVGAAITVTVSYTDGNGTPETLTSAPTAAVANVNDLPVGNVTISGTAVEDGTLTADTSAITDADGLGTFVYQWSADGVAITGATNATFTPGDAEVGAAITVTVSYSDGNGTPETLTSAATDPVANVNDAPVAGTPSSVVDENTGIVTFDLLAGSSDVDGPSPLDVTNVQITDITINGVSVADMTFPVDAADFGTISGGVFSLDTSNPDIDLGAGQNAVLSFSYEVTDGVTAVPTTATFQLNGVNDAPTGAPTATLANGTEDVAYTVYAVDLLAGFSDPDMNDTLAVADLVASPGSVVDNEDGTFTVTLPAEFNGSVTLTYTVSDGTDSLPGQTRSFDVAPVNDPPTMLVSNIVTTLGAEFDTNTAGTPIRIADVSVTDIDGGSALSLTGPDAALFEIVGGEVRIRATTVLNQDVKPTYTVTVNVSDPSISSAPLASQTLTISLTDAPGVTNPGTAGDDVITGTSENDTLTGGAGNDTINGLDDPDTIDGGSGFDTLDGGAGNDIVYGGTNADTIHGGDGDDYLDGGEGHDRIFDAGTGNDTLIGGGGNDVMWGGLGNDHVSGGLGNDTLHGNAGFDTLRGDEGDDRLFGDFNRDFLYGGADNDVLNGGDGSDDLFGEAGNDTLLGGNGDDLLEGGDGDDSLVGNAGFDRLVGGAGNDILTGAFNRDIFIFSDGFGHDIITDFDVANETIDLRGVTAIDDFDDLVANHLSVVAGVVVIEVDAENTITLDNLSTLDDLGSDNFLV